MEEAQRREAPPQKPGFVVRLKHYPSLLVGDARQWLSTVVFSAASFAAGRYYLGHMNSVWTAGILAILFSLPLIGATRLVTGFWRDRKRAQEKGGPLAVYSFQFASSFILILAGMCMYVFRERGSFHADADAKAALELVAFGGIAAAYNYVLGRRCAKKAGGAFPRFRETLSGISSQRVAQG